MKLSVAFQMDHISSIDINTDTTLLLAQEAQARGHNLFHYQPQDLYLKNGKLFALVQTLKLNNGSKIFFSLGEHKDINMETLDIVLMRQDPPFNMNYITSTYMLETIIDSVLVINNPKSVRDSPEKLLVNNFKQFIPPTLISSNQKQIEVFREEHGDIILKPLYGNGGEGVVYLKSTDKNFSSINEIYKKLYNLPLIVQKFLDEVVNGDKRIIILNGNPIGCINRIPANDEIRANMHVGAIATKSSLTNYEKHICNQISPELKKRELFFVGIDIIGGKYLTEINVTSPTGLKEINNFDQIKTEKLVWDGIEEKYRKKAKNIPNL